MTSFVVFGKLAKGHFQNYLLFLSRFGAVPIGFELRIVTARPSKVSRMCYFTSLTELLVLVMAHLCYLEPQTKKEVRAKGQRKKTARVWNPSFKYLGPQQS